MVLLSIIWYVCSFLGPSFYISISYSIWKLKRAWGLMYSVNTSQFLPICCIICGYSVTSHTHTRQPYSVRCSGHVMRGRHWVGLSSVSCPNWRGYGRSSILGLEWWQSTMNNLTLWITSWMVLFTYSTWKWSVESVPTLSPSHFSLSLCLQKRRPRLVGSSCFGRDEVHKKLREFATQQARVDPQREG